MFVNNRHAGIESVLEAGDLCYGRSQAHVREVVPMSKSHRKQVKASIFSEKRMTAAKNV